MLNFFLSILKETFYLSYFLNNMFNYIINFSFEKKTDKNVIKEKKIFFNYGSKNIKEFYAISLDYNDYKNIDILWAKIFSKKFLLKKNRQSIRSYFRVLSTKQGFYNNFNDLKNYKNMNFYILNTFLTGFKYIWLAVRFWILPVIIFLLIVYFTLVLRSLPFNKIMFVWVCVVMFVYWLISGFVFFFKKYQFGKYTTSVQRFWRRTYILFWMIEGGTFLVFMFFTFNSSQESFYMYDQISIFKTHLYSWKYFLLKIFPIIILLISCYFLLISLKWNLYSKQSLVLLFLTFFLSYLVWLEFYQFFHVLNFYGNLNWIYDVDDHTWTLELEPRRTRIVNHYVMLLFILKFWHIVFIYGFWIFFVLRCWETKRIRYPLLAANFQNFVILYIFAWVFMYPWIKFYLRKFLDVPYYWFYINNRKNFIRIFFNDLKLIYYGFYFYLDNFNLNFLHNFKKQSFFYWKLLDLDNNYESYRKHVIKDRVLASLVNLK